MNQLQRRALPLSKCLVLGLWAPGVKTGTGVRLGDAAPCTCSQSRWSHEDEQLSTALRAGPAQLGPDSQDGQQQE